LWINPCWSQRFKMPIQCSYAFQMPIIKFIIRGGERGGDIPITNNNLPPTWVTRDSAGYLLQVFCFCFLVSTFWSACNPLLFLFLGHCRVASYMGNYVIYFFVHVELSFINLTNSILFHFIIKQNLKGC
jgi:hypothetical protein